MTQLITIFGLAIAGIDPLGAIILASAIGGSLARPKIIAFAVSVFVTTVATGTVLSVIGMRFVEQLSQLFPSWNSSIWLYVDIGIAALLIAWIVKRTWFQKTDEAKPPKKHRMGGSMSSVIVAGALFGVSAVFDPTFVGTVGVAAQTNNLFAMIGLHSIWVLLSQFMLFALLVAFLLGRHNSVIQWAKHFWHRHHKRLVFWFHGLVYAVALLFLVDAATYVVSGSYLI